MVMPCCSLCYKKYLDEQGEVDVNRIKEMFGESAVVEKKEEVLTRKETQFIPRHLDSITVTKHKVLTNDKEYELCTCECHQINLAVMH